MTQAELDFTPPHSNETTSLDAAFSIEASAETLRSAVLVFIAWRASEGATDEEIQRAYGMSGNTERPRRRELVKAGLVEDSGARRRTATGREAIVWRVRA